MAGNTLTPEQKLKRVLQWIHEEALPALKICANIRYELSINSKGNKQTVKSPEGMRAEKALRTFYHGREK